ncbi:hypothetical protein [Rhizobium sp. RCC_161_2]|uniref:hypothetical protein n=1 Tax=Rhizobium sp. RCC_161_2 TaxID=3239219 RepID=UPI003523C535
MQAWNMASSHGLGIRNFSSKDQLKRNDSEEANEESSVVFDRADDDGFGRIGIEPDADQQPENAGCSDSTFLQIDAQGVGQALAVKDAKPVQVSLDYQGNIVGK